MSSYGPEEHWPDHPKPWWRETLDRARSSGWRLDKTSDHTWGVIRCPQSCKIVVFSSGRGGETVAISARRIIARCTHGPASPLAKVVTLLGQAEQLIDAAQELLARQERETQIEEMLAHADRALSEAEEEDLLGRIDELSDSDDHVSEILDDAQARINTAKTPLKGLPSDTVKAERSRARALRVRIDGIRAAAAARSNVIPLTPKGPHHER